MIENTVPILSVADLNASIAFHRDILGFRAEWTAVVDGDKMAGLVRDGCTLMLCQSAQGKPGTWVWIGVEHAGYFQEIVDAGAEIAQQPTDYPWAYELRVADPDGNILRIGAEPRVDRDNDEGRTQ